VKNRQQTAIRGLLSVGGVNLLARGVGYGKHIVITAVIGLSAQLDAFYMAATILAIAVYTFGDVFDSLGVPRLVEALQEEGEEGFRKLSGSIFSLAVFLSGLLVILLVVASPLAGYIAPGFDVEKRRLVVYNLYYMLPVGLLYLPYHAVGSFLRARRRFQAFYVGELLIALVTLLVVLLLNRVPFVLPISFSVAYVVAFSYLVLVSRTTIRFFGDLRNETMKEILRMLFRLIPLYAVFHLLGVVDRMFASYLPTGGVSALSYGALIAGIPISLLMIENVFITPLSEVPDKETMMRKIVAGVLILAIPVTVFTVVYSREIVRLAFQRGLFDEISTEMTAKALRLFALGIPAMFLWPVCYRLLQVLRRVEGMVGIAIVTVFVNAGLNHLFLKIGMGISGLALATSSANYLLLLSCLFLLARRGVSVATGGALRVLLISVLIAGAAVAVTAQVPWGKGAVAGAIGPGVLFVAIVGAFLFVAPGREIREWRMTVAGELLPRRGSR
jgi:putative peptidoglycan lipid II flippase